MSEIIQKTSYSDNLELMLEQYRNSTNLRAGIDAENDQAVELEKALFEIRDEYYIDVAVGVQLNVIGAIIGVDRGGLSDADYRIQIKAQGALIGSGEPEFIISVLKTLFAATFVKYYQSLFPSPPAMFYLLTDSTAMTSELIIFSPAGVQPNILFALEFEDGTTVEFEDGDFVYLVE